MSRFITISISVRRAGGPCKPAPGSSLIMCLIGLCAVSIFDAALADISFNRDIRPILSENCYSCHGPDKRARKAERRIDNAEGAYAENGGARAFAPGDLAKSDAWARVNSTDPDDHMPPPKSGKKLKPEQIALLKEWIEQGANYEPHWAFIPPKRPAVPALEDRESESRNPIDAFLAARLAKEGLTFSREAEKTTLIRRANYDLSGLPPTPAEVDAFLADTSSNAWDKLVDRLLVSPLFGEKMAVHWLDLSRYADTHGYHLDAGREQWPWRDWVIEAFNRNLPFNQFVEWQLAGDLLPNATTEQALATGFVRNNMINFEGGAIPEEYLAAYIKDRVNTTGTVFLGLTVACAECHDHKFDPFTQRDFYQLYAYFNAVPENGLDGSKGNAAPVLQLPPTAEQTKKIESLTAQITAAEKHLAELGAQSDAAQATWEQSLAAKLPAEETDQTKLPADIAQILALPAAQRDEGQRKRLQAHYREKVSPLLREPTTQLAKLRDELAAENKRTPNVMVMQQMERPRDTFILTRGQYDQHGEKVEPGVPASLAGQAADAPKTRLGLARWLTDPQHPLMARVAVNRIWKNIMGAGIVKTVNDFGSQGEWPKHPELLDWLAVEFRESGWDVKRLIKLIVTSTAYRQSARVTPELLERDPENRLLARGPRFRLGAEEVRDTALAVSGLLTRRIGGPSVLPYQPAGLWEDLNSRTDSRNWTAQFFEQSHGEDLYRRSLYTFWKRTSPPPQMLTFDAPDREVCTASRERTNTPLQALVMLNDPQFVEASRMLAERMIREGGTTPAERAKFAFRLGTARAPGERELAMLLGLFEKAKIRYAAQPDEAIKLLSAGEAKRDESLEVAELAAWTMVASTILNLDETITKG
jgi:Protein of unknown function (DUF1553)/Protein of unknown function (DUF1549)/Planctomycete cytochrome C